MNVNRPPVMALKNLNLSSKPPFGYRMKQKMTYFRGITCRYACVALLLCGFVGQPAAATPQFFEEKFWLELPADLARDSNRAPHVPLILRDPTAPFPTFNIVVPSAALPEILSDPDLVRKRVLESYRQVGFLDVREFAHEKRMFGKTPGLVIWCKYSDAGNENISMVGIVSGTSRHFILTFIDRSDHFGSSRALAERIFASFSVDPSEQPPNAQEVRPPSLALRSGLVILAVLGALLLLVKIARMRSSQPSVRGGR